MPKWSKEAFNDKLKKVKSTIENPGQSKKNHRIGKLIYYGYSKL